MCPFTLHPEREARSEWSVIPPRPARAGSTGSAGPNADSARSDDPSPCVTVGSAAQRGHVGRPRAARLRASPGLHSDPVLVDPTITVRRHRPSFLALERRSRAASLSIASAEAVLSHHGARGRRCARLAGPRQRSAATDHDRPVHERVEPTQDDRGARTYAFGSTIVAAAQFGRFFDGGASDIGFATSTNGAAWTSGTLPGITKHTVAAGPYDRVSDPSMSYDAAHNVWLVSSLALMDSPSGPSGGRFSRAAPPTAASPGGIR